MANNDSPNWLLGLSRTSKRRILWAGDMVLYACALIFAFYLRLGSISWSFLLDMTPLVGVIAVGGVLTGWLFGFYNTLIRAFEFRTVNMLASTIFVTALFIAAYGYIDSKLLIPRSIPVIFVLIAFPLIGSSRVFARWFYGYILGLNADKQNVLIYGAGETGSQVASVLSGSKEFALVGFIDDDETLHGQFMRGRRIFSPADLEKVIERFGKVKVFLSITNLSSVEKRAILQKLKKFDLEINILPSLTEIVAGRGPLGEIRSIAIEDLLGRETVPPIKELFEKSIKGKTVFITGAGGSIGAELSRQIVANNPKHLIAMDVSELAIYRLREELREYEQANGKSVKIDYLLGNVCDRRTVRRYLSKYKPDIVYHAAAYKHVPIVEDNVISGLENNIVGTEVLASEAKKAKVSRFILISTDKAVRPTNVMGATKRVAELVIQAHALGKSETVFSMVRFGNVLGSSGSVVPLFRSQIEAGGPITVTHRDVTRYFMTIPEAAQLVIQAGFLARGGEVFLLDMGEPVNISDLAEFMINLSGLTVKNEERPHGDIEIIYTGLRPGEKLYEELLISDNAQGTFHSKIMKAHESHLTMSQMKKYLEHLDNIIGKNDREAAINLLQELVSGFRR